MIMIKKILSFEDDDWIELLNTFDKLNILAASPEVMNNKSQNKYKFA